MTRIIVIALLCLFVLSGVAFAQSEGNEEPTLPETFLLPDSTFYFLVEWSERLGTLSTFGDEARVERYLKLAERRMAEAVALGEKGKLELAEEAFDGYLEMIDSALERAEEAKGKGLDTAEILDKISEATLRHQGVLADVYERVPEEAKPAIERAKEQGMRGHEEASQAISGEKREEVMGEIETRRQDSEVSEVPEEPGRPENGGQIPEQAPIKDEDIPGEESGRPENGVGIPGQAPGAPGDVPGNRKANARP